MPTPPSSAPTHPPTHTTQVLVQKNQRNTVQFKMVPMQLEKPTCTLSHLSEVCPMLPLKCWVNFQEMQWSKYVFFSPEMQQDNGTTQSQLLFSFDFWTNHLNIKFSFDCWSNHWTIADVIIMPCWPWAPEVHRLWAIPHTRSSPRALWCSQLDMSSS